MSTLFHFKKILFFFLILTLTKAIATPQSSLEWFNQGVAYYNQKQFSAAKTSFNNSLALKTKLTDAALYYSALSTFNLEQYDEIPPLISKINSTSVFYKNGQDLLTALKNNSDSSLQQALAAYQDYDYESCLELIEDSIFVDHPQGAKLRDSCKEEIEDEKPEPLNIEGEESQEVKESTHQFNYYADLNTGYTNNLYLVNTATTSRGTYQIAAGADYIIQNTIDWGLGVNYSYNNVVGLANSSDSLINIYIPLTYYLTDSNLVLEAYLNSTQNNSATSYRQTGANAIYNYYLSNFVIGLAVDASVKKAILTTYNYVNGNYTIIKGALGYAFNKNNFSTYIQAARNNSEDQAVTGGSIPYANNESQVGATLSFWVSSSSRFIAKGALTRTNYLNKLSANNILRIDSESLFKLKFEEALSSNIKLYVEGSITDHKSNYGDLELANKNYKENSLTLGLFFNN
ncbi:MAG: hypothetical protein AABY53_10470 [Bdellovibrionota bacterium]